MPAAVTERPPPSPPATFSGFPSKIYSLLTWCFWYNAGVSGQRGPFRVAIQARVISTLRLFSRLGLGTLRTRVSGWGSPMGKQAHLLAAP